MEKYVSEQELNEKAVAPRVTLEALEANIVSENYFTAGNALNAIAFHNGDFKEEYPEPLYLLTFCVLVLKNGFTVTGQSACASPENFDAEIGQRVARGDAIRQVWALMGYELRSKLHAIAELKSSDDRLGEALTHLTAAGLGNDKALKIGHIDTILNHFIHSDHQEEGGRTFATEVISEAVALTDPELDCALVERNELGSAHPEKLEEPTITEESLDLPEERTDYDRAPAEDAQAGPTSLAPEYVPGN